MKELFLLDAMLTETNAVKLEWLSTDGEFKKTIAEDSRPYFLVSYPLSQEQDEIIALFSGSTQALQKIDLFSGEKRVLAKVSWPNAKIAARNAKGFGQCWESEIDPAKSYVYDRGLIFGALHSESDLKPVLTIPTEKSGNFDELFGEVKIKDSLKHEQLFHWFSLLDQPIPDIGAHFFGIDKIEPERLYTTWMLSRIANIPLREAFNSKHVSEWLKSMIYTHLRKNNVLIPTPEELRKEKLIHTVPGALTVAPSAGIYFNTVVCDFESLYPSCIDNFNLSYETVDCQHADCKANKIAEIDYHVCVRRRGFYSILIGALKELRIRLFKPNARNPSFSEEQRRAAGAVAKLLKLITVSSYGVTVRIHGLACPPLAEAITGYGRHALSESWRLAEGNGMKPVYGDTDSLFLDNASEAQVDWLVRTVKERYNLDLAVEKRYSLCVLPKAKKAYFGILTDGTPDIKGVTASKSNSAAYTNRVFQLCVRELASVKDREEYERVTDRIKGIVSKAIADLRAGKVELPDLTYSVRLYFDPNEKVAAMKIAHQPYQCALQVIESGKELKKGDTVTFIKVRPFKYKEKTFTVKPATAVTSLADVNVEDYVRNLLTALNQTFAPMGITLETRNQTDMFRWLTG